MKSLFISRVKIKNYRNFKDVDVRLGHKQIIIGENNVGKTNFLKALRLILDPTLSDEDRMLEESDFNDTLVNPMDHDKINREQANELEYVDESQKSDAAESANASSGSAGAKPGNPEREKPKWEDTITNRMLHWSYTPEQKEEVKKALAAGVPKATILTYFYPEVTVERMSSYRKKQ